MMPRKTKLQKSKERIATIFAAQPMAMSQNRIFLFRIKPDHYHRLPMLLRKKEVEEGGKLLRSLKMIRIVGT
ncbi:hypothetical protein RYX36_012118 [Vicia faba]